MKESTQSYDLTALFLQGTSLDDVNSYLERIAKKLEGEIKFVSVKSLGTRKLEYSIKDLSTKNWERYATYYRFQVDTLGKNILALRKYFKEISLRHVIMRCDGPWNEFNLESSN